MREKLLKIATTYRVSIKEVENYYDSTLVELRHRGVKNAERVAFGMTLNYYRTWNQLAPERAERRRAIQVEGFLIGAERLRDRIQEMINRAVRHINNYGRTSAIRQGLINNEGEYLDTREQIFGRPNPNYGKVIPKDHHEYEKVLYGVFRRDEFEPFKLAKFTTNDNRLAMAWEKIDLSEHAFKPCKTYVLDREAESLFYFNASIARDTRTVFTPIKRDWDIEKILRLALKPFMIKIRDLKRKYEEVKNVWDRFVALEGQVVNIRPEWGNKWFGVPARLLDIEDIGSTCRINIPYHIKINFGEYSEVLILGKPNEVRRRSEDGRWIPSGEVRVDCLSVYPIPNLITELSELLTPKEEFKGWRE